MPTESSRTDRTAPVAEKPRKPARARAAGSRAGLVAFAIGLTITGTAFVWTGAQEDSAVQADLERRGATLASSIQRELSRRTQLLAALGSYVVVSQAENRGEMRSFISELTRRASGSTMLDWVPIVTADVLKSHEEKQWLQGATDFRVHVAGGPLPSSLQYLPLHFGVGAGSEVAGLDFTAASDLSAVPSMIAAFDGARAKGTLAAAQPVTVVRADGKRPTAVYVMPVVAPREPGSAAGDGQLLGYTLGLFDVGSIAFAAIGESDREEVSIDLRDSAAADAGAALLFQQRAVRPETEPTLAVLHGLLRTTEPRHEVDFDIGGRRWAMSLAAGSTLIQGHISWTPWVLVVVGIILSIAASGEVTGSARRGAGLAVARRRLDEERRESMEKLSRIGDELERERLDRRRTEESLFREKQQFRLMFNAVPAMIWYKDTKNRFLLVNENAAISMGRSVEEMEGRPCSEILPAKAYELYRDDLEIIQTGKPRLGLVEEIELPSGKKIWTRTDKLPEYDAMGRVVGILVFSQDISGQRQAEAEIRRLNEQLEQRVTARTAELESANQELESFTYSVSHDLRGPLRSIDGFSKLILEEHSHELSPDAREYLDRLRAAAQRMGQLIDDLLRLTRVSRGELEKKDVDLSMLARQALEDLRRSTPGRRVDIVVEATPFTTGDPGLLTTVVENLVGNAWKFTSKCPEPRIEFGSKTIDGERTAFYVRDNGVGFDMVYADKLFGAFERLHSPAEYEGSGIGLKTVQTIVRRHAGEVWAESAPDKGATFYFTLGA